MITLLAAWTAALPVVSAAPIPIETKGIPDDGGGRLARVAVPGFGTKLDLTIDLNIQFVPVQADINRVEEQMRLAQTILCDATDGVLDLVRVRVNLGRSAAEQSDIWWRRDLGPKQASGGTSGRLI